MKPRNMIIVLFAIVLILAILFMIMVTTNPADNLTVEESDMLTTEAGTHIVTATLKNQTESFYTDLQVGVAVYSENDSLLQTLFAKKDTLNAGTSWKFTVEVPDTLASSFRIETIRTAQGVIREN